MRPTDQSTPKLAAGCRWQEDDAGKLLLTPEAAIRLQGAGLRILELCDGRRCFAQIVAELHFQHCGSDPIRIREETAAFLDQLHAERVLVYE